MLATGQVAPATFGRGFLSVASMSRSLAATTCNSLKRNENILQQIVERWRFISAPFLELKGPTDAGLVDCQFYISNPGVALHQLRNMRHLI
jgi:hypothetical protein